MVCVTLRFYGNLNDLVTVRHEGRTFERRLPGPTSVKDLVEGCGVPHTEVDLILVNDQPVGFAHLISDGQRISVYPVFSSIDMPGFQRLQPRPTR